MSSRSDRLSLPITVLGSALGGAAVLWACQQLWKPKTPLSPPEEKQQPPNPEKDYSIGHGLIWNSIGGAMTAAMLYTGDKLKLYEAMRELCAEPESYTTAIELANETGYNQRWIREWLAQQAGAGILHLLPGDGDDDASLKYRLPWATAQVLANPSSSEYDISMIQMVPALVNRARTMLPEAFKTGIGRPYDEPDVAEAIDRHHTITVRDNFIPKYLPMALNGAVLKKLTEGCNVADLGCGAGMLLVALAAAFPKTTFHGFEISTVALEKASYNVAKARLSNLYLHNANEPGEQLVDRPRQFDVVFIYDVLHDSTHPADLVNQVAQSLKRPDGVFLLADIPSYPTIRQNLSQLPAPATYFGFSACLCMSCSLSTTDGAGMGTLGFSIPVAKQMLASKGFSNVEVMVEDKNSRWFLAHGLPA